MPRVVLCRIMRAAMPSGMSRVTLHGMRRRTACDLQEFLLQLRALFFGLFFSLVRMACERQVAVRLRPCVAAWVCARASVCAPAPARVRDCVNAGVAWYACVCTRGSACRVRAIVGFRAS